MTYLLPLLLLGFAVRLHAGTIQEMVDAAKPGDTMKVPMGIHRETVVIKTPLTLEGEPGSEIRGSDVWTQWESAGKVWKSNLTVPVFYHYGYGEEPSKWPEQVFIGDTELKQVFTEPKAGEFTLDAQRHILLGQSPEGSVIEVTTRQNWINFEADGITLRNLRMKHAASDAQANAALPMHKRSNCVIDTCILSDTHGCIVGLGNATGNKLLNSEVFNGGQTGVSAGEGSSHCVISGNRIHDNDRSSFDAGWDGGGIKVCWFTDSVVEKNEIWNNRGPGLWCDVDCANLIIRDNRMHHNGGPGIHYEISKTAHITGNVVWENGRHFSEWGWGAGILLSAARECEVDHNLVGWNRDGISVVSAERGREDWNQVVGNKVHDNIIIGTDADPSDPKHNNIYILAFLQDWKGILAAPGSNNIAENNRIYLPGPDRSGRFAFVQVMGSLEEFNASPGGKGNAYMTEAQAQDALKAKGVPLMQEN